MNLWDWIDWENGMFDRRLQSDGISNGTDHVMNKTGTVLTFDHINMLKQPVMYCLCLM